MLTIEHKPKNMKVYKLFSIEEIHTAWKTGDERILVVD